ncbi:MAG: hypothetical protein JOZ69_17190 [Myxococcales bacterium]|nr:hypothetical protein [Myxococcales bacterium]
MSSGQIDPLRQALERAIAGQPEGLRALLARGSHLPGTRMNVGLAEAFAQACRTRGTPADPVALSLARLSPDEAPGASEREFLPVCGLYAAGARAAADAAVRATVLALLHGLADDPRFRVRDAVVHALVRLGQGMGDVLLIELGSWMDGYFHTAAVLRALAEEPWLGTLHDAERVLERLDDAFALAEGAPRAAARWPGHKELLAGLGVTPAIVAARFGAPVFDRLVRWSATNDPALREVVEENLRSRKLAGRFATDVARVRDALQAALPPPRNPDHDVGPTRNRSGARRRTGNRR